MPDCVKLLYESSYSYQLSDLKITALVMVALNPDKEDIDYDFRANEEDRKARLVYFGGGLCFFTLLAFSIGNALVENYYPALVKLCFLIPVAIGTLAAKKSPVPQWAIALIAVSLLSLLTIMLYFNEDKLACSLWFLIAPILLISGLGINKGLIASALQLIVLTVVFQHLSDFYPESFLLRFYAVYFIVTAVSYIREHVSLQARRNIEALLNRNSELEQLLPICAWCKQIRDNQGHWHKLEAYMSKNSNIAFSHGICQECVKKQDPA